MAESSRLPENSCLPMTRSALESPEPRADEAELRHIAQTDHYLIIMHHVEFRDSVFVQTLTDEDMVNLNITDAERAFSSNYVVSLNEMLKNQ